MNFKRYLLETKLNNNSDIEDVVNFLNENCKPFMRDWTRLKGDERHPKGLFRGIRGNLFIVDKKQRKNRSPRDTPASTHELLDELFEKKFGIPLRSQSVFCIGSVNETEDYGDNVYLIIPVGNFEIYWSSEIGDLYADIIDGGPYENIDDPDTWTWNDEWTDYLNELDPEYNDMDYEYETWLEKRTEQWKDEAFDYYSDVVKKYKKGDLKNAISSGNEIMLVTNQYIGFIYDDGLRVNINKNLHISSIPIGNKILYYYFDKKGSITKPYSEPEE